MSLMNLLRTDFGTKDQEELSNRKYFAFYFASFPFSGARDLFLNWIWKSKSEGKDTIFTYFKEDYANWISKINRRLGKEILSINGLDSTAPIVFCYRFDEVVPLIKDKISEKELKHIFRLAQRLANKKWHGKECNGLAISCLYAVLKRNKKKLMTQGIWARRFNLSRKTFSKYYNSVKSAKLVFS